MGTLDVKWLVEDFEGDGKLDPLIAEIKKQGMECDVVNYVPFQAGGYNKFKDEDCVVFYGSLNLVRQLQREKPWIPGSYCNFNNLKCVTYYSHWGKYLLNHDYIMLPLLEFSRKRDYYYDKMGVDGCVFMRPDSGAKTFYGNVYPKDELDSEIKLMDGYAGLPLDEILVVTSCPKVIYKEWRIVVVDGEPISATQYKKDGKLNEKEGCDVDAWLLAQRIAKEEWQPDRAYTLDICKSNGRYSLLEANSFSCSGLYDCPVGSIVREVSRVALEEWMEYNEG